MADDGVTRFGLGALVGGAAAYWLRGMLERSGRRAERAGRAVGAETYGSSAGSGTLEGTLAPRVTLSERAERAGRGAGARVYGARPADQ